MVAAIDRKVDRDATPDILPAGVPVLQPTDERRRSGSHYTPRSLTEPIVSEALRPVLESLGALPKTRRNSGTEGSGPGHRFRCFPGRDLPPTVSQASGGLERPR